MRHLSDDEIKKFSDEYAMPQLYNRCCGCKTPIGGPRNFRDAEARYEFLMTGLCQACQDKALNDSLVRTVLRYTQEPAEPLKFERKIP